MPVSDKVARLYRAHRGTGLRATTALYLARNEIAARANGSTSFGAPSQIVGRRVRWCENVPFRFVGYADEIAPFGIRHAGWFLNDDTFSGEVARGVVYQIPARDGAPRYVAGYHLPATDGECAAAIEIERLSDITEYVVDAAYWSDGLAERAADVAFEHAAARRARDAAARAGR